jgi:hypothetical protein
VTAAPARFSRWLPRSTANAPARRVGPRLLHTVRVASIFRNIVHFDLVGSFEVASHQLPLAQFLERYRPE